MAISRMQQPRQMYGLGSFVKKTVGKITKPFTKAAGKVVPKEIAGIMRTAAPFLPPGYREAAYLLGTAKQTGRISPVDLALTAAPTFFSKTDMGRGIAQRVGNFTLPGMEKNLRDFTLGTPAEYEARIGSVTDKIPFSDMDGPGIMEKTSFFRDPKLTKEATSGILGEGGKMFQFGTAGSPKILDTKAGQFLLGGEDDKFSKSKVAGVGLGVLSLIQNSKTPQEAGEALVAQTGNSEDYERGVELFSSLPQGIFDIPEAYRLPAQGGGLMRTNYANGTKKFNDKYLSPEYQKDFQKFLQELREQNKEMDLDNIMEMFKQKMRRQDPILEAKNGGLMRTNYANGSEYITKRPNFFKDLFLEREGGGGKDYMIPMEASTRADLNEIFTIGGDDMKKAEEIEAKKILPSVYDQAMRVIDAIQDIDDEETSMKMIADVNSSFNKTKGTGLSKAVNSYYRIIEKYGYLLDDKKRGLGSMQDRKAQQSDKAILIPLLRADGGLTRTNYAMGSDDDKPVLPEDPTKPVNPFAPKPIKPLGDMKMAEFNLKDYMEEFERVFPEMMEKRGTQEYMDMLEDYFRGLASKDKEGIMMAKKGGRANLALGTKPTPKESGLGGLPIEADMRYTGGFMPYGAVEKADDVPARLSKNEFVFTADAVRAAGGGSVNEGAKKMYATMKQLEKKPEAKGMTA